MTSVKMSNHMPEVTKLEMGKATLQISFHLALNHMHGAFVLYFFTHALLLVFPAEWKYLKSISTQGIEVSF